MLKFKRETIFQILRKRMLKFKREMTFQKFLIGVSVFFGLTGLIGDTYDFAAGILCAMWVILMQANEHHKQRIAQHQAMMEKLTEVLEST